MHGRAIVIGSGTDSAGTCTARRLLGSKAFAFVVVSALLTCACGSGASAGNAGTGGEAGTAESRALDA